jgi:hypothetical protein
MDSIPENLNPKVVKDFERFLYYRLRSDATDSQIADLLDYGSPKTMYRRFNQEGFPVCEICGAMPVKGEHCKTIGDSQERQAQSKDTANRHDIPQASKAQELFWPLVTALERAVEDLPYRREHYQDGRFVASYRQPGTLIVDRDDVSATVWEQLCTTQDKDPTVDRIVVPGSALNEASGGSRNPPEPLTILIGMYLLADEPLEPLLRALHRDLPNAEREQIERLLDGKDGLRRRVKEIASLVCGGKAGPGRHEPEFDSEEHYAMWYVTQRRKEGATDEQIVSELNEKPKFLAEYKQKRSKRGIILDDVRRWGTFRQAPPNS